MIKLLAAVALCFHLSAADVSAQSKRIFRGLYIGNSRIENATGNSIFFSPVRFKIDAIGNITGTAYDNSTTKLLNVRGKINQVTVESGLLFKGKATGTFSDGTKWRVTIQAMRGTSSKALSGFCVKGAFTGSIQATKS